MAKTYADLTVANATAGNAILASDFTTLFTNSNNYRVPPMVRVLPTNATAYTSAANISFAVEDFDTDDMWSAGDPTKITINTAGVYLLTFSWHITGTSVTYTQGYLKKNASTSPYLAGSEAAVAVSNQGVGTVTTVENLAAGDYVQAIVGQTGTGLALRTTGAVASTAIKAVWLGQVS